MSQELQFTHCSFSYDICLKLPTLKYRRFHRDMIMTYKILNGHLNVNETSFFTRAWMATRGHSCRLFKQFASKEVHQNYFSHRAVNNWNSLPSSIVETNQFKKLLDNIYNDIMFSIDLISVT